MSEPISVPVSEAAAMVGLGKSTLEQVIAAGDIDVRYKGSKRLVLVKSLRAYIESLPRERT
jgi:hypothetical protein